MQPSCRQLDCSWQCINLARLIIATGSQAPCSEATGRGLATQQPCQGGQGSWQPAHRQLGCTWQRSKLAMVVRATGSQAPCNRPAGSLMRLCNAAALQWWSELQAARQQPARHPVMLQASALQYAAQQLRSQAADSWVALGNAIGGQSQGQLAHWQLECTWQRSSYAVMATFAMVVRAKGS